MSAYNFPGLETILAVMIIITSIILITIKLFQRHAPRAAKIDEPLYTCGNRLTENELLTAEPTFYRTFRKTLRLDTLRKLHTGNLSTYLHWYYAAIIIIAFMITVIL